jgi:hypothetical protein
MSLSGNHASRAPSSSPGDSSRTCVGFGRGRGWSCAAAWSGGGRVHDAIDRSRGGRLRSRLGAVDELRQPKRPPAPRRPSAYRCFVSSLRRRGALRSRRLRDAARLRVERNLGGLRRPRSRRRLVARNRDHLEQRTHAAGCDRRLEWGILDRCVGVRRRDPARHRQRPCQHAARYRIEVADRSRQP